MPRYRRDRPARHLSPLEQKVYEAIVDVSAVALDEITPDSILVADLGFDEFDIVELAMELEDRCRVEVGDHVLDVWSDGTVRDVLKEIQACQQDRN